MGRKNYGTLKERSGDSQKICRPPDRAGGSLGPRRARESRPGKAVGRRARPRGVRSADRAEGRQAISVPFARESPSNWRLLSQTCWVILGRMAKSMQSCPVHPSVKLVVYCPACRGAVRSERKAEASRANGKRGGRPKRAAVPSNETQETTAHRVVGVMAFPSGPRGTNQ